MKLLQPWRGPFCIMAQKSPVNYEIQMLVRGKHKRVVTHVQHLKPYYTLDDSPSAARDLRITPPNLDPDPSDPPSAPDDKDYLVDPPPSSSASSPYSSTSLEPPAEFYLQPPPSHHSDTHPSEPSLSPTPPHLIPPPNAPKPASVGPQACTVAQVMGREFRDRQWAFCVCHHNCARLKWISEDEMNACDHCRRLISEFREWEKCPAKQSLLNQLPTRRHQK